MRTRLRGWGGVGAMAVACALAVVFALLLPLDPAHGEDGGRVDGQGLARAARRGPTSARTPRSRASPVRPAPQDGPTVGDQEATAS